MSLFSKELMAKEPSISIRESQHSNKPGVCFHNVSNGLTATLVLEEQINENLRVYIPNSASQFTTDADGVKSILLITEERFQHWWNEVKTWLDTNLENTIIDWVEAHWEEQFQPHVDDTITAYNLTIMNDNDNSLSDAGMGYVNVSSSPRGAIPKLHDKLNQLRSDLNQEITDRRNEDSAIRREILEQLPVGSLLPLYKHDPMINDAVKKWYLKCDGSVVPSSPTYDNLRRLLTGGNTDGHISDIYYSRNYLNNAVPYSRMQWGAIISRAFSIANISPGQFPIPLTERSVIRILNWMGQNNRTNYNPKIPENFPLGVIMGNNFRSSSYGVNNISATAYNEYYNTDSSSSHTSNLYSSAWCDGSIKDPAGQMEGNQVERLKHTDIYNPQIHFRVKSVSGYSGVRRVQVAIGQSDNYSSIWDNDLELDFYLDTSPGTDTGLLLYIEIGDKWLNTVNERLYYYIPYDFFRYGPDSDLNRIKRNWNEIDSYRTNSGLQLFEIGKGSPMYYDLNDYGGMSMASTGVIELEVPNQTDADYIYMRIGGLHQGRTSNIPSSASDDSRTKPILHPVLVYGGESPTSLWSVVHSGYRKYDGYVNYNYWNKTTTRQALTDGLSYAGYFNRFRINTDGWLTLMGLSDVYTTDQWKNFWDELIDSCSYKRWTPGQKNAYTTYPRIGGIDITRLPLTSSSNPSGFSNRTNFGGRARGANYGFICAQNAAERPAGTYNYPIRGCRTVLHIRESSNIHFMIDTDSNNTSKKNGYRGFMFHENGTWKDLGHYLNHYSTYGSDFSSNSSSTATYNCSNADWGWHYDESTSRESAGICRIRLYIEGENEPYTDVMFCEFASNKDWGDGRGGSSGDESGVGFGFDIMNSNDYILNSIQRPGNQNNNIVVVIDRIQNIYNDSKKDNRATGRDSWDCFDMGWFIDYCNNGNKLYGDNKVKLPDLTRDGVFIGGGSNPGNFKRWTMPNLLGGMSTTTEGAGGHWGVVSNPGGGNHSTPAHTDWSAAPGFRIDLNNDIRLREHIASYELHPDHHQVSWFIKFK